MMEALSMGEYGAFVWSSYGLTLIVLVVCAIQARRRLRKVMQDIARHIESIEAEQ